MATELIGRLRGFSMHAGVIWLAFLLYEVGKEIVVLIHEFSRLRDVGATTLADRASQLKPWLWKAPFSLWALGTFMIILLTCLVVIWLVAIRNMVKNPGSASTSPPGL